jgi:hypothetical protein
MALDEVCDKLSNPRIDCVPVAAVINHLSTTALRTSEACKALSSWLQKRVIRLRIALAQTLNLNAATLT